MSEIAVSNHGMVVAPCRAAAETGRLILVEGGDAYEAMVGMAATMAVVWPHRAALGGDGVWLVREPSGVLRSIDAVGRAGARATIALYRDRDVIPARGSLSAVTAPGAVDGWRLALEIAASSGGRLPLAVLMGDAIRHARDGVAVSRDQAKAARPTDWDDLVAAPGFSGAFLTEGEPLAEAASMVQPKLADALEYLTRAGLADFYRGDVAREMADDLDRIGSVLSRADFRSVEARLRKPIGLRIERGTVHAAPPAAAGLVALIMLGLLERLGLKTDQDAAFVHAVAEAAKRAGAIGGRGVADPDHLDDDPSAFLTPAALDLEAAAIDRGRAAPVSTSALDGETGVWMGAIDVEGRAVSHMQGVGQVFGSGCVLPATGVLMANRGRAFSLRPDDLNPLAPGRRPRHALNPSLAAMDDGRLVAFGAVRPETQCQVSLRRLRLGRSVETALAAPRATLGAGGEASLALESGFDGEVADRLERIGHAVEMVPVAAGDPSGLIERAASGRIEGGGDPRTEGCALGL